MQEIIQRRFFLIFYPVLLILTALFSLIFTFLNWNSSLDFLEVFFETQFTFVFIISILYFLKGVKKNIRLMAVLPAIIIAAFIWNACLGFGNGSSPISFSGPWAFFWFLLTKISIGFAFTGILLLTEKYIMLEKENRRENLKQLANERKVTESHLKYLNTRIEPQFLLNTLTGIAGLRKTDMDKARTLQLKLIVYLQESMVKTKAGANPLKKEIEHFMEGEHDKKNSITGV